MAPVVPSEDGVSPGGAPGPFQPPALHDEKMQRVFSLKMAKSDVQLIQWKRNSSNLSASGRLTTQFAFLVWWAFM